jgi:hypothetical protein
MEEIRGGDRRDLTLDLPIGDPNARMAALCLSLTEVVALRT